MEENKLTDEIVSDGVKSAVTEDSQMQTDSCETEKTLTENIDAADGEEDASIDEEDDAPADIYDFSDDLNALKAEFPELQGVDDIARLKNPTRYAALRDLGLTAKEAYLATSEIRTHRDNRAHLGGSVPRAAGAPASAMSARELREARALFGNISDNELIRLYKRVTAN